ncbi:response regulator transcription factor [Chromobacterium piscinae]|uniref:Response regulator transcription factor n=1 Tax=Chromobacterium piscinae TaxID=686831 RepID=A0ABV0H4K0_9NEIS|nr:response regulator transcription factor [Chromobacterium piscinae]MBX9298714.1 response regulator transcription factor [Chromobacterium vaccinii]MBX9348306.1 response regulator transcription factor [Chromobacterium vaccinii]MBX9357295.1 response regulator transcription factor [Chromobacterium vaccinii]MCD4503419.1 response regulator transcription factor [Chromobacterium piscinae]MCD5329199.1 response regulator transcription factor [Chromobacterium piscinae]
MHCNLEEKHVLIIENHPVFAFAIKFHLSKMDSKINVTICSCAETAREEFLRHVNWFRVFVDLDVPKAYGLSLVRYFAQQGAHERCVIVTGATNPDWIAAAKEMGILGYIAKTTPYTDFMSALRDVVDGHKAFPSGNCARMPSGITRRQYDVLCLLQRGYSSKQIAEQLKLNSGTINNHVASLLRTLNVSSRTHAVAKAMELGYI